MLSASINGKCNTDGDRRHCVDYLGSAGMWKDKFKQVRKLFNLYIVWIDCSIKYK